MTNDDGGQFVLAWECEKKANEKTQNVVLIYPGALSDIETNYVHEITESLNKSYSNENFVVAVITNRGFDVPYAVCLFFSLSCKTNICSR